MRALLARCQALRLAITDAVATVSGTGPDRASYQVAVETAQTLVIGARNVVTGAGDLTGDIGRAVLESLHGTRRPRVCARRVKSPLSRWARHPPGRPATCQPVTKITTEDQPGPPAGTNTPPPVLDAGAPDPNSPALSLGRADPALRRQRGCPTAREPRVPAPCPDRPVPGPVPVPVPVDPMAVRSTARNTSGSVPGRTAAASHRQLTTAAPGPVQDRRVNAPTPELSRRRRRGAPPRAVYAESAGRALAGQPPWLVGAAVALCDGPPASGCIRTCLICSPTRRDGRWARPPRSRQPGAPVAPRAGSWSGCQRSASSTCRAMACSPASFGWNESATEVGISPSIHLMPGPSQAS